MAVPYAASGSGWTPPNFGATAAGGAYPTGANNVPSSLPAAGGGIDWTKLAGIAGAGSQLLSGGLAGRAAEEQAEAEAASAEYNAQLARMRGRQEASAIRRMANKNLSAQYTNLSATSGLIVDGSNLAQMASNAGAYEVEALNAAIAARNTARLYESRAQVARRTGSQKKTAHILNGVTAGLGALSRIV
jgi:hypothetical protein